MTELHKELCVWRANRQLYPGWLIAPYQTRDKIWHYSRYWLEPAIQSATEWRPAQVLILWRELSWRLDTCLQLVPDQTVDALQHAVNSVQRNHETVDVLFDISSLDEETWPKELRLSSQEFREYWVECMLTLLQSYRYRPDLVAFQKIAERLLALEYLSQNQKSQVLYQSCLVALGELDPEKAMSLLEAWPNEPEDPYWLLRKAGVFLELGDQLAATSTATEALGKIRRRRHADRQGLWGLSREGWCLRFLSQISRTRHFLAGSDSGREELDFSVPHRNFDRELEESRCSPDTEIHLMQERISGRLAPGRPVERTRNWPDFDSGARGETIHFGSYEPAARLGTAVNLLRLCDLSGLPPSVGNVAFFRSAVSAALLWIREEYPGLWAAFVLRFRGIGIDEHREPGIDRKQDAIQRAILDVLPLEQIKRLYDAAMRELRRAVNIVSGNGPFSADMDRYEAIQAITRLGDAASRFAMCLDHDDREHVFELFLRVSRTDMLSARPIVQGTLRNVAYRTVAYFSPAMVNKWATEIFIQFPAVNEETQKLTGWLEISSFVYRSPHTKLLRPTSPEFDEGVAGFIKLLRSGNLIERTGAAWRLLGMYDNGLLSESECEAYRNGLWSVLDDDGLPNISQEVLRKIVHLQWPTDDETKVVDGLLSWVSSQAVRDRFTPQESEDGTGGIRYTVTSPDPDQYLSGLLDFYYRLATSPQTFDAVFTRAVRVDILVKILEWWQRERDRFRRRRVVPLILGDDVFQRVEVTLQVLFNCVLGSAVAEEDNGAELREFLEELKEIQGVGVYWSQVAAYLKIIPVQEYWAQVRGEFWRNDAQSADKALASCSQWIRRREALALTPVPGDVLVILMSEVANVRGERCRQVCRLMAELVELGYVRSDDFDLEFLKAVVGSAALQLNDEAMSDVTRVVPTEYREMRPHLRRELTRLMVAMEGQHVALDEVGKQWLIRRKTDRFIDVRALVGDQEA